MVDRKEVEDKLRLVIASGVKSQKRIDEMLNAIMINVVEPLMKAPEEKKKLGAIVMTQEASFDKKRPNVL